MAIIAFAVTVFVLHQVHAVGIRVCGNLEAPVELGDKHFTIPAVMAAGGKAVRFAVLPSLVQAVGGDVADTLARSERP